MYGILEDWYRSVWYLFNGDEFSMTIVGTFVLTFGCMWGWSFLFAIVDIYQWPKWMLKYKIQQGTNQPVDKQKLWKACKLAFLNTTVMNISWSIVIYPIQQYMGCTTDPGKLPTLPILIRDLIIMSLIDEAGFYYVHRLVHWGPLYRWYHKQHHEWTAPVGVVSHYAHPVEHFASHNIPFELGAILLGSHVFTQWVWVAMGMTITVMHHSGYHLPFVDSPEFHDYHHLKFNVNYGGFGLLDWLHGTDYIWRDSVQKERHFTFYNFFKSVRDFVPDRKSKKLADDGYASKKEFSNGISHGYNNASHEKVM